MSPSFVCFSLLHYAGDLWVWMSVLVSRINLLFASGIGEKTQLCRNMKPAVPSPGNRDKSWSSGKRSTDLGESTQGSARGSFFFFFFTLGCSQKAQRLILDVRCARMALWTHGRLLCPLMVCDLTGAPDIEQIITQLDLSLKIVVKPRKEKQ